MIKLMSASLAVLLVSTMTNSYAENIAVGTKVSTLGVGVEVSASLPVVDNLNGRLGFNYFSYDRNDDFDGIDYESDIKLNTLSALLDWHPLGNGLRLSGGLFYNKNEVSIESTSTGNIDIGGTTFPIGSNDKLVGDIEFDTLAPYLGIGYGHHFDRDRNLSLTLELGVLFQGSPDISLRAEGPLSALPGIQAAVQREEDDIQDDADDFEYYPVLSVGLSYQF